MLEVVVEQRRRDLGGFEVGRLLPDARRRMVGPFVFFDHMGPVDFSPGIPMTVDVRPHPHIGLSTLTYLFDGEIMHRDSIGSEQPILPGEVNWMTAGRGITHSERFVRLRATGGRMDGIQAWVALPDGQEEIEPAFEHHGSDALPTFSDGRGMRGRLIAGKAFGETARVTTHSPMFYAHVQLAPGAQVELPWAVSDRAAYVARGSVEVDGQVHSVGRLLVAARGTAVVLAASEPTTVMLLGGEPIGDRYLDWNFVSSSKERIAQAKSDWRAGRMKLPDLDDSEFIPLPPD